MTLPVVKCILSSSLMSMVFKTPLIRRYNVDMTKLITSEDDTWIDYMWVFNNYTNNLLYRSNIRFIFSSLPSLYDQRFSLHNPNH